MSQRKILCTPDYGPICPICNKNHILPDGICNECGKQGFTVSNQRLDEPQEESQKDNQILLWVEVNGGLIMFLIWCFAIGFVWLATKP